jgi:hypothetical protein
MMKTDSTKLFDMMLEDSSEGSSGSESRDIEKQLNEKMQDAINKMQDSFDKKLKESEERINNLLNERRNENEESNGEEGERTGADEDQHLSGEE